MLTQNFEHYHIKRLPSQSTYSRFFHKFDMEKNSEIIQKSELDTIQILGKVVGKVGLVGSVQNSVSASDKS